ncbi:stage II sporulation protein M, partial [Clostridium sp. Cult2]|uniref:stage II sporulation protein M n=1 Tax=Clostridium sp. Cult2 TaxID=2079003 RepID=UPI001F017C8D
MPNNIKRWLFKQFQDNFIIYFLIIILFAIGIIIGSITIKVLDFNQKNDIMIFLNSFFQAIDSNKFTSISILKQSIIDNFKTVGVIWISGMIYIGIPIIPITIMFRGFALGFTVGFLVNEYGIQGFLFSILGILPQNLFIIPGIVSIASIGIAFSINCIKRKKIRARHINLFGKIVDYTILIFIFSIII